MRKRLPSSLGDCAECEADDGLEGEEGRAILVIFTEGLRVCWVSVGVPEGVFSATTASLGFSWDSCDASLFRGVGCNCESFAKRLLRIWSGVRIGELPGA